LRALRFTVRLVSGRTRHGGQPLRVLYAGGEPYDHYLRRLWFDGPAGAEALGRRWLWQLPALARRLNADIAVTRTTFALRGAALTRGAFYLPEWVWCDAPLDIAALPGSARQRRRTDLRKLANRGIRYRVTTDAADLRYFYDRMYVPTTRSSHGEHALFMSRDDMLRRVAARDAELVSILHDGAPVGGCLLVYGAKPRVFSVGVLDGDREWYRAGAGLANYVYSFEHLRAKGFTEASLGRCRPFLNDGPLVFKKRLGARISGAEPDGIVLRPLRQSAAVTEILAANPFLHADRRGLHAVLFSAQSALAPAVQKLVADLTMPGFSSFTVLGVEGLVPAGPEHAPPQPDPAVYASPKL
jgi:hypothetical protein